MSETGSHLNRRPGGASTISNRDWRELASTLGLPSPTSIGDGLWACVGTITADAAKLILTSMHVRNRTRSQQAVDRFGRDMDASQWALTHQGIAFNTAGHLCDGQTRLAAAVASGHPFRTVVFFGLHENAMRVLDSGRPRTAYNAATIAGLDYSSRDIAAVRAAVAGCSRENVILTTSEVLDACVALEDSLGFIHAIARSNVGRGINGTTLAVGLRGFYHIEADRLNLFFECLKSGVVSCDEDNAAARLLQRINSTSNGGGSAFRRDLYMRTQNALLKFSQRQPIKMLYPADSEKFPWPERIANRLEKGVTRGNSRSLHTTPG